MFPRQLLERSSDHLKPHFWGKNTSHRGSKLADKLNSTAILKMETLSQSNILAFNNFNRYAATEAVLTACVLFTPPRNINKRCYDQRAITQQKQQQQQHWLAFIMNLMQSVAVYTIQPCHSNWHSKEITTVIWLLPSWVDQWSSSFTKRGILSAYLRDHYELPRELY